MLAIAAVLLMSLAAAGSASAENWCPQCVTPTPFQPSPEAMKWVDGVYKTGTQDLEFSMYGNQQSTIVVDGVPYAKYWQLKDKDAYVFHPLVWGRFVYNNSDSVTFRQQLPALSERIGVALPNGGLAFYYPDHYPLFRLRGPDIVYSAIGQSEILSGFLKYDQLERSEVSHALLKRVRDALFMPYEEGGIDLGVAQLEFPMYRSNPEIILNGWLHSLLNLNDYAHIKGDTQVAAYIRNNLQFFADNHSAWYDEERNISKYSDTSPHQIVVTPTRPDQAFRLIHRAKDRRLKDYIFEPVRDLENKYSALDFRIIRADPPNGRITMGVTCSSLFHSELASDAPFSFTIRGSGYDPMKSTPISNGKWHTITAEQRGERYVATLELESSELMCGHPTNFNKKNKKNFYHIQHIVALTYLASDPAYDDAPLNARLLHIASEWHRRTSAFALKEYQFENPQEVLDSINRGKSRVPHTDAAMLAAELH